MGTPQEANTNMMTTDRRRVLPGNGQPGRQRLGRVLLVEDEQDVAELIRYNLTKEGYDVVLSANGNDALRLTREHRPDVLLLDIMVPQLNGWEVCRRLKKDPDLAQIPVIMVSGRVEEGDKVLGFEVGADDYVTKPFSPRELIARIRAVLRRGRPADGKEKKASLKVGDLEIDRYRFEVRMKGRQVRHGLGPRRLRRAPDGGRPRGASARKVLRREARGAWNRDRQRCGLPLQGQAVILVADS